MKRLVANILVGAVVLSVVTLANARPASAAVILGFENISANDIGDAAIGEAQLSVSITDPLGGMDLTSTQALFTFLNAGPDASSITDIYFEDGTLLAMPQLIDADDGVGGDAGVDFSLGASPGNLPSANSASPPFVATTGMTMDSDPPAQPNGVNPGESLGVLFDLVLGMTLGDTYDALLNTGALRIGIHVQGFDSGGSESFVSTTSVSTTTLVATTGNISEPASLLLLGLGLLGLGARRFRRS